MGNSGGYSDNSTWFRFFFSWIEDTKSLCTCFDCGRICGYLPCALFLGNFYQSTSDPEDWSACWNHCLTVHFIRRSLSQALVNLKPWQATKGVMHLVVRYCQRCGTSTDGPSRKRHLPCKVWPFSHHPSYSWGLDRQEQWLTALDLRVHSNGSLIAQTDIGQSAFDSQCLCSSRHLSHLILGTKSIIQPSATTIKQSLRPGTHEISCE